MLGALSPGAAPDRFLVGLGVLSLVSDAGKESPLLCIVDDAQWLDQESALTLAFVARRLLAEPVGLLFAAREPGEELRHVPDLEVHGLLDDDAHALLSSEVRFTLDERVRDRIVAEMHGNPLALLELPRGFTATQLAGGFGLLGAEGLPGRIEESFVQRLKPLAEQTRLLLLVAAAEPLGDPLLLWRAAERLGIWPAAAGAAEAEGLVAIGERVTFRHPLVRSAMYRSAAVEDRRAVHLALAEATDRQADPDRRAWHLAAAAEGPDEQVAAELERSAGRAQARGGVAAAAAEADWEHLRTAETYLGYARSEHFASPSGGAFDERRAYRLPERLRVNHWALAGEWTIGRENAVLGQPGGSIAYRFHARDAHLVLSSGARAPIPFRVLLDGEAPGPLHGVAVDEDGNGVLHDGRLYQLVREHDAVRERTVEITFREPGAEAYVFTFG